MEDVRSAADKRMKNCYDSLKGGIIVTGFLDNTLNILNSVCKRRVVVQDELARLQDNNCKNPEVPCCLLQAELNALNRYKDILERELFHEKHSSEAVCKTISEEEPDWVKRLREEWSQLCIRMERLDNFRDRFREDAIDFVPKWGEKLLCDQLRAMRTYRDCLLQYAKIEGIELDMTLYNDDYRYDYYFERR